MFGWTGPPTILTRMHQDGFEFTDALKGAQEKGLQKPIPLWYQWGDAAHKLTILSSIASNSFVVWKPVCRRNYRYYEAGHRLCKILRVHDRYWQFIGVNGPDLRVHPTLVENKHLLSAVSNELNAIFVRGVFVGNTMFYGPERERPTASYCQRYCDVHDLSDSAGNGRRATR